MKPRNELGTWSTGPAVVAARGPSPGTISTASNAPAIPAPEAGAVLDVNVLRASCRLLSSERVSSPLTIPPTVVRALSICSMAALTLTSSTRLVTWLVSTKPSARITANDSPRVSATTRNCSDRRQAMPTARLNAPMPRLMGPERPQRLRVRRREPLITCAPPPHRVAHRDALHRRSAGSRGSGLVTHSSNGQHHSRVLRVLLDLGPQTLDVHVHQTGVRRVTISPHLFEQHITSKPLARFACQRDQQVELQRGQGDLFA